MITTDGKLSHKLREIMTRKGVSTRSLADLAGVGVQQIYNLISENSKSHRLRQKCTDLLVEEIWPGVRISGRLLRIPGGAEVEFETADQARQAALEFGSNVTVTGRMIRFVVPTRVVIHFAAVGPRERRISDEPPQAQDSAHEIAAAKRTR